ncbi:MAG: hypothetical protein A2W22_05850 [Candidatus Levybacteria bacterium RBG_16_35_11]|nr:MAG: hypothetical protein A2W22_05850 [Candidatus Levybacteria bacterium RBG_16_35_11]
MGVESEKLIPDLEKLPRIINHGDPISLPGDPLEKAIDLGRPELEGSIAAAVDLGVKERIGTANVEIRLSNLDQDATRIAELFRQSSVIEHLAGIAPTWQTAELNVKRYAEKYPDYHIVLGSEEGIKDLYKDYSGTIDSDSVLLVAEDKKSKRIAGTITIVKPMGRGMTHAMVTGHAVDKNQRQKGIGTLLLETAHALIFLPKEMNGFELPGAEAGIILGLEGNSHTFKIYKKEGYLKKEFQPKYCVSWDNKQRRFVERDTRRLLLSSDSFWKRHKATQLLTFLPRE